MILTYILSNALITKAPKIACGKYFNIGPINNTTSVSNMNE